MSGKGCTLCKEYRASLPYTQQLNGKPQAFVAFTWITQIALVVHILKQRRSSLSVEDIKQTSPLLPALLLGQL